jgi:curli biogenesis system outer membrane secretion channel CsgG
LEVHDMTRTLLGSFLLRSRRAPGPTRAWIHAALVALLAVAVSAGVETQSAAPKPLPKPPAKPAAAAAPSVDTVIEAVKSGIAEPDIISSLKEEGRVYKLTLADQTKLKNAGVSAAIIATMKDPTGGAPGTAPSAAAGATHPGTATPAAGATPFPPDLPDVPQLSKRALAVKPFKYGTVLNWVNYWFHNDINIGEGIRSMLGVRLAQSKNLILLERTELPDLLGEQDLNASNRVKKGTGSRIGQLKGADAMLYGDIVIFGRDDTTKRKGLGAALGAVLPAAGAVVTMKKEEKAVVGITLRLVDAETGEFIETAEARGESSRSSMDYGGVIGVKGVGVAAANDMTSSNFQQTIIGEATSNAVTKIVEYLEKKIPSLPARPREIEGRVATITSNGALINVGAGDAVMRGDRFEILKINGEVKDPVTKEVIDLDAVKVGELVIDTVRDKTSSGQYGGQPLSTSYATTAGKGYVAKLMVRK